MSEEDLHRDIVVVGAGIIGLDVALVLAERGFGHRTTVVATHLPGDTSIDYTSPWAGCNFSAISGSDANALKWDRAGYAHLTRLAATHGDEAFVKATPSIEMWDENVPRDKMKAMSEYLKDFKIMPQSKVPDGVKFAAAFTTFTVNAPKHIEYIHRRLQDQYGVRFVRQTLPSIAAAFKESTRIVFNCTGNGAMSLPDVADGKCFPTRGQVVLVRAPRLKRTIMRHGLDYQTYIIPRPGSNGNVILGGYMQSGVSDGSTYGFETESILTRTTELAKELQQEKPEVLAVFAGLRPSREGGARIERVERDERGLRRTLVHNYGAGGTGFQAGYGMALDAVDAVGDILREMKQGEVKARL